MREEQHFEFLKDEVLLPNLKKPPIGGIKIWSAASSTGEEPYCITHVNLIYFGEKLKVKSVYNSIRYF